MQTVFREISRPRLRETARAVTTLWGPAHVITWRRHDVGGDFTGCQWIPGQRCARGGYGVCPRVRTVTSRLRSLRVGADRVGWRDCWSPGRCAAARGGDSSRGDKRRSRQRRSRHRPRRLRATPAATPACSVTRTQEQNITHSRHGQAKDPRSPAATLGCESCHGPGQAHVDDDAKGNIKRFGAAHARRGQRDLSVLPQPRHARGLGRERSRGAEPDLHDLPQRAHAAIDRRTSW